MTKWRRFFFFKANTNDSFILIGPFCSIEEKSFQESFLNVCWFLLPICNIVKMSFYRCLCALYHIANVDLTANCHFYKHHCVIEFIYFTIFIKFLRCVTCKRETLEQKQDFKQFFHIIIIIVYFRIIVIL